MKLDIDPPPNCELYRTESEQQCDCATHHIPPSLLISGCGTKFEVP